MGSSGQIPSGGAGGRGGVPAARGGGGPGGIPISFERRRTSKDILQIEWDYPASIEVEDQSDAHTVSTTRMYALPKDEALERLRGDDPRPLLVLRECNRCKGTADALLSRSMDNERTLLLARWFHCVKLKRHVIEEDHTFYRLFEAKRPPHVFLATADGSVFKPLPGDQSQSELWDSMLGVLDEAYEKDARKALKQANKLLSKFDHLDSMEDLYREQIETEIERRGPRSGKVKALQKKLDRILAERAKVELQRKQLLDLELKPVELAEGEPATPANASGQR